MATLSELLKRFDALPKGNIYIKTIYGKKYHYYQYFDNGKRYTQIVDSERAKELLKQIEERKLIKTQINELQSKRKKTILSNNAKNLTGTVMSGNIPVAEFENGKLLWVDDIRAPLSIKRTHGMEQFLNLRVIDMSRTNARLLKKALNIDIDEEYKIPLYSYALSISDNYWFKPKFSKVKYNDLVFNNDIFSDTSLKGDLTVFPYQNSLTPEITTPGSFEKGWKLIDKHWYLYKTGDARKFFSEIFSYKFAELIDIDTVTYEYDGHYIRSKNFAEKYNFEPIAALFMNNEDYNYIFDNLLKIDSKIAKDYVKLIFFDSVIYNVDRHNENLGLLRDRKTGQIISLAPNFDNNMALISTVEQLPPPNKDAFINIFVNFLKSNETAKNLYKEIALKEISLDDIKSIVDSIDINVDYKDDIPTKVLQRYNYLKQLF